ncbi:MAG: c-type cytochrome, partial [Planctomycetales bacterium]
KDLPPVDQRITDLINQRREAYRAGGWDKAKGEEVFAKNCAACHRLGGKGNKVGPELDGVGIRGLDRLLEDTLSPSTNVDQAFRATIFATKDGKVLTGLVLRKEGDVFVVADDKGKEQRIPAQELEEQKTVKLSPMPADVAEKISPAEFSHLIFLLLNSSAKPAPAK